MTITKKALDAIMEPKVRMKIALQMNCSDVTVQRWIRNNDDCLTKAAVLTVIKQETGLEESEILQPVAG